MGILRPKATRVEITLNDHGESIELAFCRFSLKYVSRAREIGKDLGSSISVLVAGTTPQGREITTHEADGSAQIIRDPADADSIRIRREEIDRAIHGAADVLLGERTIDIVKGLVRNSLRLEPNAAEIVDEVFGEDGDIEVALQLTRAAFKANGKSFGPLAEIVRDLCGPMIEKVQARIDKVIGKAQDEAETASSN